MITKLRKIIACCTSIFLIFISIGIFKPNFSGKSTISDPTYDDKSAISLNLKDDQLGTDQS